MEAENWVNRETKRRNRLSASPLAAWYCTDHAPIGKTPRATTKDTRGAGSMWTGPVCPARPGDSTHTHTNTLNTAHQSSCCHNNPPCALLIGTACLARQQQGPRRETDTQKVTQQTNGHVAGDWLRLTPYLTAAIWKYTRLWSTKINGACEFNKRK